MFLYHNGMQEGWCASRHYVSRVLSHVQTLRDGIYHAYHCDEQGSTAYMTGPDGGVENSYRYDAFGNLLERKETVPNRVLYMGQQYDQETGQYYLRARYYNPVVGRFLQEDTYHGDGLNLYAYCANNPVVYYDPSGHDSAAVMKKAEEPDLPVGVGRGGLGASDIRNINGQRTSRYRQLSNDEISQLLDDIEALEADLSIFRFNAGNQTGFLDSEGIINVRGDVLPDLNSNHPRDLMSPRAVLAHEYYGHKHFDDVFGVRNPLPGSWNDEFRASYNAALYAPNLSDMDKMYLMLDALERAKEAGVNIKITDEIRRILYGY